jgi:hypothetical protein
MRSSGATVFHVGRHRDARDRAVERQRGDAHGARHHRRGDRRRGEREHEERQLLQEHGARGGRAPGGDLEPPQGIDVEDEEHHRQGHHHRLRQQAEREQAERRQIPAPSAGVHLGEAQPGERRQQVEERAQHVAALGDPRHRLRAERVQGKEQRGAAGAQPPGQGVGRRHGGAQQAQAQGVDERDVGGMQEEIAQVIAERVHAPQRVVDAVGEPGHRRPVPHDGACQHPAQLNGAESAVAGVRQEIAVVVVDEPAVAERGREDEEGDRGERQRHAQIDGRARLRRSRRRGWHRDLPCHWVAAEAARNRRGAVRLPCGRGRRRRTRPRGGGAWPGTRPGPAPGMRASRRPRGVRARGSVRDRGRPTTTRCSTG